MDMVFQNNNKNAIYVLNTSYNTYGEFGRPNNFGYAQINSDEIYNNSKNCSISKSFHKLKSLRLQSSEIFAGGGIVGAEGVSNATENNSSSSMTSSSPTAAALQKLFNCSSSTAHSCKSINYRNNTLSNNNCHISPDLSHRDGQKETGNPSHHHHSQLEYHHLMENQMSLSLRGNNNSTSGGSSGCGGGGASCVLPCVGGVGSGGGSGKKKHFNSSNSVKSALIAKKTKFWKYLVEEEKWRKHSDENLSTSNCERDRESKSNSGSCSSTNRNNSNWSGKSDTNKNSNINQKSSAELYKEAAQILGLSCTLCDNCRCLECQSRYFECDDSDSYSEFSLMDEYFENLPTEGDRNFHHRSSSPTFHNQQEQQNHHNLQNSQQDEITALSEDKLSPVCNTEEFQNNVLDHCESLNDLTLEENFIENEN